MGKACLGPGHESTRKEACAEESDCSKTFGLTRQVTWWLQQYLYLGHVDEINVSLLPTGTTTIIMPITYPTFSGRQGMAIVRFFLDLPVI